MLRRVITVLCVLALSAVAKEEMPLLTSADGSKKIHARPIAVADGKVMLRTSAGKTMTVKLDFFSERDRTQLKRWMDATQNNPHAAVVKRVKLADSLRVLFVGNSYSFKIPKEFEKIAKAKGKTIHVEQVTKGGWTLRKHAGSDQTIEKITKGKWDIVVLQEQSQVPSFIEKQRAQQMDEPAKKLAETIRKAGALPVFFLTWGRRDGDKRNAAVFPNDTRDAMQKRLNDGYANAATFAGGAYIVPVGKVWSATMKASPDTALYARDGSHPAKLGNTLGASVFYTALFNEPCDMAAKEAEAFKPLLEKITWKPLAYPLAE